MASSARDRKAAERERMRRLGFVPRQMWVHADDWELVRQYVERKRRDRVYMLRIPRQ